MKISKIIFIKILSKGNKKLNNIKKLPRTANPIIGNRIAFLVERMKFGISFSLIALWNKIVKDLPIKNKKEYKKLNFIKNSKKLNKLLNDKMVT